MCRCAKELEAWEVGGNVTCNSFQWVVEVGECHSGLSSLPSAGEATETVYRMRAGAANIMEETWCEGESPYLATLENVASMQACSTACAGTPACTSWNYETYMTPMTYRICTLFTGIKSTFSMAHHNAIDSGSFVCGIML